MDRLDCQFIMALCTNVHYAVFIAPPLVLNFKDIMEDIEYNNTLNTEITKLEHDYEDATAKDEDKDNKMSNTDTRLSPEVRRLKEKIDGLRLMIKSPGFTNL